MKAFLSFALFSFSILVYGQNRPTIKITVENKNSTCFDSKDYNASKYKKSIDSAFVIMCAVFNTHEFQAALEKNNFPCENRCCISCNQNKSIIIGKEILDSLYNELSVSMTINLESKCHKKLGFTNYKKYYTTACLKNIIDDMPKLPLSYAIAVNLCHEYMHHIGFYHSSFDLSDIDNEHPNPDGYKNDIAYRVGWDAYYLLKKWYETGVKIEDL
jgi:hypothetical protein